MSLYQVQQCLFDYLRAKAHAPSGEKPDVTVEGYDLDEADRKALTTLDVGGALRDGCPSNDYQWAVTIDGVPAR
jgi:hypothetical protein